MRMPTITPANDNRSLFIDGKLACSLPTTCVSDFYDLVQNPTTGNYSLVPEGDNTGMRWVYTVCVDHAEGKKHEFRNFNTVGNYTQTHWGYLQPPELAGPKQPDGIKSTVYLDLKGKIPARARGVDILFDAIISTTAIGLAAFRFGPDQSHQSRRFTAYKPLSASNLQVYETFPFLFREQHQQKIWYQNDGVLAMLKGLQAPKWNILGWYLPDPDA